MSIPFVCCPKHQPHELFLFLSNPFEIFLCIVINTSKKSALCLNSVCSHYFSQNLSCYQDLDNQSVGMRFSLFFDL